jgi:hypothetical protein
MRVNAPIEVSEAVIAVATERTTARNEVFWTVLSQKKANPARLGLAFNYGVYMKTDPTTR